MATIKDAPTATVTINGHDVAFRVKEISDGADDDGEEINSYVNMEATVDGETIDVGGGWIVAEDGMLSHEYSDGREYEAGDFAPYNGYEQGDADQLADAVGMGWSDEPTDEGLATREAVWEAVRRGSRSAWKGYQNSLS